MTACANLNALYLAAARNRLYARQGRLAANDEAQLVAELFARDAELARRYNEEIAGGKWRHMMDQTHIGYTSWQEPRRNVMPRVSTVEPASAPAWGVAVEGSDAWWPAADGAPQLRPLTPYDPVPATWFEIFRRGSEAAPCTIACDAPWVRLSTREVNVASQERIDVTIDWTQAPAGPAQTTVVVTGPHETRVEIAVAVDATAIDLPPGAAAFVDANGVIAIEAEHFARAFAPPPLRWQVIPDFGRTLSGVTPLPVTTPPQTPSPTSPHLCYEIYLREPGEVQVSALVAPTLDFADAGGLRYAVALDDAQPQVINILSDRRGAWDRTVADNINVSTSTHDVTRAGAHTLKFWMVDPGIVLERLVVARGDVPRSYLGPPESRLQVGGTAPPGP